jgi:hypothetical protein
MPRKPFIVNPPRAHTLLVAHFPDPKNHSPILGAVL